MDTKIKLMIIDDNLEIIESFSLLISTSFPNFTLFAAKDAISGFEIIEKEKPDIIVADIFMPEMTGIELTKMIRNQSSDSIRDSYIILFTGVDDKEIVTDALDSGADDFLMKPFLTEELISRIRAAKRIINQKKLIINENRKLLKVKQQLEQDMEDMKLLGVKLLQARVPSLSDLFINVAEVSLWIANELNEFNENEKRDLQLSAFFCYSGKIFLPDLQIKTPVMTDGIPTNELMYNVPISFREILSSVEKLQNVAKILYHLYENFDGTGIPDRLQSWQIPLSSRIIRVVLDFFEYIFLNHLSSQESLLKISNSSTRLYDQKIVSLLEQYLEIKNPQLEIKEHLVKIYELESGMILTRDIVTDTGFTLIKGGTTLTQELINILLKHNTSDPILGSIGIKI